MFIAHARVSQLNHRFRVDAAHTMINCVELFKQTEKLIYEKQFKRDSGLSISGKSSYFTPGQYAQFVKQESMNIQLNQILFQQGQRLLSHQ